MWNNGRVLWKCSSRLINIDKMKKISAEIVADSINPQGDRIPPISLPFPVYSCLNWIPMSILFKE